MYAVTRKTVAKSVVLSGNADMRIITAVDYDTAYRLLLPVVKAHGDVLTALGVQWSHEAVQGVGEVIRATGTDMEIVWSIIDIG